MKPYWQIAKATYEEWADCTAQYINDEHKRAAFKRGWDALSIAEQRAWIAAAKVAYKEITEVH